MNTIRLEIQELAIPFRTVFKHAASARTATQAVIVTAYSARGNKGYGEGCPRDYVTGEDISSAKIFFSRQQESLCRIVNLEQIQAWIEDQRAAIDKNPAAWCAIETALLDLMGQEQQQSLEQLLSLPELRGIFTYTAVLGINHHDIFQTQLAQYMEMGFTDFKVKISGDAQKDQQNIEAIRQMSGTKVRIRVDANNLWADVAQAINYLRVLGKDIWAVEEPLKPGDYAGLASVAAQLGCKIILDENFLSVDDFCRMEANPGYWLPNIRISKMGGILRSLRVAEECKKRGLKFILGAQVGETSILSRAALCVANAYRSHVEAQEGAFGMHLLKEDVTDMPVQFGKGGALENLSFGAFGLGLRWRL